MLRPLLSAAFAALLTHACDTPGPGTPVRATLGDGQVLVGDVQTETLLLDSPLGRLAIPLDDIGEVVPVEGGDLQGSGGNVGVWLRNGTELRGAWAAPELRMGVEIGQRTVSVDIPVDELYRFQLEDDAYWPTGELFRVRTRFGDDFLVDPQETRLVIESSLGTFDPLLSECASATPIGDPTGDWRIELHTGTTLIGPLADDAVTFALPMGPTEITVSLVDFAALERQVWAAKSVSRGAWFTNDTLKGERASQYAR